jgi:hypothetical protein
MPRYEQLTQLIETYEAHAALQDATADHLVTQAEREGWHDDLTQQVDRCRRQAGICRMLAQEVRDGMAE